MGVVYRARADLLLKTRVGVGGDLSVGRVGFIGVSIYLKELIRIGRL